MSSAALAFVAALRIHDIQGRGHVSPYVDQQVEAVGGVVTRTFAGGFYMQDAAPDDDVSTSEAIRVASDAAVAPGDVVAVSGTVREVRPGCAPCSPSDDAYANLTITELEAASVAVVDRAAELPAPIGLGSAPGERAPPSSIVEDDVKGDVETSDNSFDPGNDGLDFYESLEGMLVAIQDARVVGPSVVAQGRGLLAVVPLGTGDGFSTRRGGLLGPPFAEHPERVLVSGSSGMRLPAANVGDRVVGNLVGVIDYAFGDYDLVVDGELPAIVPGVWVAPAHWDPPARDDVTLATFNLKNLSVASASSKLDALAEVIVGSLAAPDVLVLQEIQDSSGPPDDGTVDAAATYGALVDAIRARGGPPYVAHEIAPIDGADGGEPGGNIRVAILVRQDSRLKTMDRPGGGPTTAEIVRDDDGVPRLVFSPGRIDPDNPAFLQSRKPLALELDDGEAPFFVVGVHFNSQLGDAPTYGRFQPPPRPTRDQRIEQARAVAAFVGRVLSIDASARVVVAGDMNDVPASPPLAELEKVGLHDLLEGLPVTERYTSNFGGSSEALDHLFVSPALVEPTTGFAVVHTNVDFARGASDHDPLVARFALPSRSPVRPGCQCQLGSGATWRGSIVGSIGAALAFAALLLRRRMLSAFGFFSKGDAP